jgi:transposase
MSRFKPFSPEQSYLLPPSVRDELGSGHLCFFVRRVVDRLDLGLFEQAYNAEGGMLYAPELMLGVWLYAYAVGITSARQLERRLVEDIALRYLAGGAHVDNWALSAFRRRHGRALNDAFTQVLEWAQSQGLVKLGRVAIDSTRIQSNASRDRVDSEKSLRDRRAKLRRHVRRWQQAADRDDSEPGGAEVVVKELEQALTELGPRLERLKKSGLKKLSRTDPDARFLRTRGGRFVLGYSAEIAVSDDHFIVAQRVTQESSDNHSLKPMVNQVRQRCRALPDSVLGDSGFFSIPNLKSMEQQRIDAYIPDSNLARTLNLGTRCRGRAKDPAHKRMRAKLRSDEGKIIYARRKAIVEPVFGVEKQQRGMRQFRTRGLERVSNEFTLTNTAYNITRLFSRMIAAR